MKCNSCSALVDARWSHSINSNVCPFCGQGIMEEHLKNLLVSLRETMESLKEYPDQVNDWLLSNHNFIKTDSPDLHKYVPEELLRKAAVAEDKEFQERKNKKFTVTVKTDAGEEQVEAETLQSEERTNGFAKRAETIKPKLDGFSSVEEKTQHLKEMVKKIKRSGSFIADESGMMPSSPDNMSSADPEEVMEMQAML